MRKINKIILHCTATPEGKDFSVDTIRKWHTDKGWSDVGYHYIVYRDGSIHEGRPLEITGAHVRGQNRGSIGIAYVGGMDKDMKNAKDTRTDAQKEALEEFFIPWMCQDVEVTLHGHNEFSTKACPSFDVQVEYDYLINPYRIN